MTDESKLALIVDDEPDLLSLLAISLGRMGIDTVKASNVKSAKQKITEHDFDLCLTDLRLPDGSGLEIIEHISKGASHIPIAVITAFGEPETAVKALKAGAFDYVCKPIEVDILENLVKRTLKSESQNTKQTKPVIINKQISRPLIGESSAIKSIHRMIEKVAPNQAPVHISGETGTGKELIANLIHDHSLRNSAPFIPVNCGAIPKDLMESEFFGHKKGSFTNAHHDTDGLFRAAHGGTLFLDEIGELPVELQVKLLRAIQEKKIRSVGDTNETTIDVRLISATNKNLSDMIEEGTFREDFYYRVNVIPIHAPSLNQRLEDIPLLTQHILQQLVKGNSSETPTVTHAALEKLSTYNFPGNVRQLENILERSYALLESNVIDEKDIILPEQNKSAVKNTSDLPIDEHINQIEVGRIIEALNKSNGNVTAAARALGTTFRSLRYRIKKLNL